MLDKKYIEFLFSKGILVNDKKSENAFAVCFALARQFNIRITKGAQYAHEDLIPFAADMLGLYVPLPFYRNFPQSVRELTKDQLLLDQLIHYTVTYGFGDFSKPGYSCFEKDFERLAFREEAEIKSFVILQEEEAIAILKECIGDMLQNTRPLNDRQYDVLRGCIADFGFEVPHCACKDTAIRLLFDTRKGDYAEFLSLSDVIKLVDRINAEIYHSENLKKLNLRNADRKFITKIIDLIFEKGRVNVRECFEKKVLWCGLLHHIHYQPKRPEAETFVSLMRGKTNESVYAEFERAMAAHDIEAAVDSLRSGKGSGALLRQLNYIVSRCKDEKDLACVTDALETKNALVVIQLIMQYASYEADTARTFRFTRYNRLRVHKETPEEQEKRQSVLPPERVEMLLETMQRKLRRMLSGKLGRIYISPAMYRVALPLQENTANGGYGVLPKGSRLPIPKGKKIRAFTYWKEVDDIDLSVIGLGANGEQMEFSWRTMYGNQSGAITFSGDQTSGYSGGSDYFDIDLPLFRKTYPNIRYLVFCDNVYSYKNFNECYCKAGYMVRDVQDTGEIFEPQTVSSSFTVDCSSTFGYLFGIDLAQNEFVWLNTARESDLHVAGLSDLSFLAHYFKATSVLNVGMLFEMLATELTDRACEADVVVSDEEIETKPGAQVIHSFDFERIMALIHT